MSETPPPPTPVGVPDKRPKERSPGYPAISLRRALELVQKFWDADKRQAVMPTRAAQNLGFTAKSSAGGLALAAMKKYGLLDDEGTGEARKVKLTDAAINILNPSNPNRKDLIKAAALKPAIHAALWAKYGVEGASPGSIQDYLVFERKFVADAAKSLIASYTDTVKLAELSASDKVDEKASQGTDGDDDGSDGELPLFDAGDGKPPVSTNSTPPPHTPPSPPASPAKQTSPALNPAIKYLAVPTDIGDAHIPMGMSEDDFEMFVGALTLFKKKIVNNRFPVAAIWRNADSDKPVTIIGEMGEQNGVKYYKSKGGTGIPENELTFAL